MTEIDDLGLCGSIRRVLLSTFFIEQKAEINSLMLKADIIAFLCKRNKLGMGPTLDLDEFPYCFNGSLAL